MKSTTKIILSFLGFFLLTHFGYSQNVGIGQAAPISKLDVNGGLTVGAAYSGIVSAPANGAIIQGNTGIGTSAPAHRLHVVGDVRIVGDFFNQQVLSAHGSVTQNIPFNNAVFVPVNNSVVAITITDGNGINHSSVFISAFARVFGGNLNGNNSSLGGYFMILQRDDNPAFPAPVNLTYTSGACYIKTPNGLGSAAIGYGGGGHVSYVDNALVAGTTYYYRLCFYANGVGITSGTYDVYQRDVNVLQIKN